MLYVGSASICLHPMRGFAGQHACYVLGAPHTRRTQPTPGCKHHIAANSIAGGDEFFVCRGKGKESELAASGAIPAYGHFNVQCTTAAQHAFASL